MPIMEDSFDEELQHPIRMKSEMAGIKNDSNVSPRKSMKLD